MERCGGAGGQPRPVKPPGEARGWERAGYLLTTDGALLFWPETLGRACVRKKGMKAFGIANAQPGWLCPLLKAQGSH